MAKKKKEETPLEDANKYCDTNLNKWLKSLAHKPTDVEINDWRVANCDPRLTAETETETE